MAAKQSSTNRRGESPDLLEYQLADKIEKRVIGRATLLLGAFVAGLTGLGLFAGSQLVSYITDKVVIRIDDHAAKETSELRARLSAALADLNVSAMEIRKEAEAAKTKLAGMRHDNDELVNLQAEYQRFIARLKEVGERADAAAKSAASADANTEALRAAIVLNAKGAPVAFVHRYFWAQNVTPAIAEGFTVDGANLGVSGTIQVYAQMAPPTGGQGYVASPFQLSVEEITEWSPNKISVTFSENSRQQLNEHFEKLERKIGQPTSRGYGVRITTPDGQTL